MWQDESNETNELDSTGSTSQKTINNSPAK